MKYYISSIEKAKSLFKTDDIPPQSQILQKIEHELQREYSDFSHIARLISSDAALAGATLQLVNSAFFGLRNKVVSIQHAVSILGTNNVINLIKCVSLRSALKIKDAQFLKEFWITSQEIAIASALIARHFPGLKADEAYTVGLFHNTGLPLMVLKFDDYLKKYRFGTRLSFKTVCEVEAEKFGTCHSVASMIMAKSWKMPDMFCNTILFHHDAVRILSDDGYDGELKIRIGVLKVAEYICVKQHPDFRYFSTREWEMIEDHIISILNLDNEAMTELEMSVVRQIEENSKML